MVEYLPVTEKGESSNLFCPAKIQPLSSLVERFSYKERVVGSIPTGATNLGQSYNGSTPVSKTGRLGFESSLTCQFNSPAARQNEQSATNR